MAAVLSDCAFVDHRVNHMSAENDRSDVTPPSPPAQSLPVTQSRGVLQMGAVGYPTSHFVLEISLLISCFFLLNYAINDLIMNSFHHR